MFCALAHGRSSQCRRRRRRLGFLGRFLLGRGRLVDDEIRQLLFVLELVQLLDGNQLLQRFLLVQRRLSARLGCLRRRRCFRRRAVERQSLLVVVLAALARSGVTADTRAVGFYLTGLAAALWLFSRCRRLFRLLSLLGRQQTAARVRLGGRRFLLVVGCRVVDERIDEILQVFRHGRLVLAGLGRQQLG